MQTPRGARASFSLLCFSASKRVISYTDVLWLLLESETNESVMLNQNSALEALAV